MTGTRLLAASALLFPLLLSTQAQAQPELGLSVGYAIPKGWFDDNTALDTRVRGQLPWRLDALYRFGGRLAIGGFAQYGYAFISGDFCGYNTSCRGDNFKLGVQGTMHFPFGSAFVPWVGIGFGYEWLRIEDRFSYHVRHFAPAGWEQLEVRLGGDYFVLPDVAFGPYLGASLGRYNHVTESGTGEETREIHVEAIHGWLEIGVRGTFSLLGSSPVFAATKRAPPPPPPPISERSGFELGLRLGYAMALGEVADGTDFRNAVTGQIPLRLDALYRVNGKYAVGVFAQYGYAFITDNFCSGASCSGAAYKLGIEATRHFSPGRWFVPWVGVSLGYEWLRLGKKESGYDYSVATRGFELLALQVGAEHFTSPRFAVGPFVGLSFGRYSSVSEPTYGSQEIESTSLHEWLELGVRGAFRL